jgi:hypothetical protein
LFLGKEVPMARAYGSSAHLLIKRETVYGEAATGNYRQPEAGRADPVQRNAEEVGWQPDRSPDLVLDPSHAGSRLGL